MVEQMVAEKVSKSVESKGGHLAGWSGVYWVAWMVILKADESVV